MTSRELTTRPVRWVDGVVHPDDLAHVVRLYEAFEVDRIGTWDSGPADIEAALAQPHVVREENVLLLDGDDVVGCVWIVHEPAPPNLYVDIAVLPGAGERERLEAALGHALGAGRRFADSHPDKTWTLRTGAWTTDDVLASVIEGHGLPPVRRFCRMRISSDSAAIPDQAPPLPDGVELVVRDDEQTRRTIWEVDNAAFLDHWNFEPSTYDDWWGSFSAGGTRDPDGWWLLTVDGDPAAVCLLDESRAEQNDGYVAILGVRPEYRGRGLATLLLQRAFVRERDRGRAGTQLAVDAENTTGAVGVYERVGMHAVRVIQGYAIEL